MDSWTVGRVIEWAAGDLRSYSSTSPRLDAELMMTVVLGWDRVKLITQADRPMDPDELTAYRELHKRRRRGEPIAYLCGHREFFSRSFVVDQRVMVPRPETELLVEAGLRRTASLSLCAQVLDLCTGSGCVAITLKRQRPTTDLVGSDTSADALAVAQLNCQRHGAPVTLVRSDLYDGLAQWRGWADLITANPPYITEEDMAGLPVDVRDFEPHLALTAGGDGLAVIRPIIDGAPTMLAPAGGILALEVGAGMAPQVADLMAGAGFTELELDRDYGGHERIVSGRWAPDGK
ncbi:MAG: peptide chain release factor N(5)-glutamine methyltransferase [Deltaproteobacteria bacterium]|nr:peptide chain release factor N(5)-glutamine methyltransferase [Deltaproteobacteria bacterium]